MNINFRMNTLGTLDNRKAEKHLKLIMYWHYIYS